MARRPPRATMKRKASVACQNVGDAVLDGNQAPKRRLRDDKREIAPQQQRKTRRGVDAVRKPGEERPSRLARCLTTPSAHVPVSLNLTTKSHNQTLPSSVFLSCIEKVSSHSKTKGTDRHNINVSPYAESDSVAYWAQHGYWPQSYFKEELTIGGRLLDVAKAIQTPRKKSRKRTASQSEPVMESSEQQSTSQPTIEYSNTNYASLLASKKCYMRDSDLEINGASRAICHQLSTAPQRPPTGTLFSDNLFNAVCNKLDNRNEAKVVQDISRLIVPSVEELASRGARELNFLIETVNEAWDRSIPVTKSRPQPDYAVGFDRYRFSLERLSKLQPYIGEITQQSYIMGSANMVLPFLTCETKCDSGGLVVADKQNMHSMMLAVRGVITLFRTAGREKELDREILAFSVSHDNSCVKIYGHYAEIDGRNTAYYRHSILRFDFRGKDGNEKWTAYRFVKNIYDIWVPTHFQRLCSVIDALPVPGSSHQGEPDDLITPAPRNPTTPRATATQTHSEHAQSVDISRTGITGGSTGHGNTSVSTGHDNTSNSASKKSGTAQRFQEVIRKANPRRKARGNLP